MLNQIDLSRIDLNLLVLFEAVLQERHVGRAADRLRLSPSAVSHGLGRLRRLMNDPLFLRTPKGVIPTTRAAELAAPISEILAATRKILSVATPFDPATSVRSFSIGAPDGVSSVLLPALLRTLERTAPGIDIRVRQLLPVAGEMLPIRAWRSAFEELETGAMNIAIIPCEDRPERFHGQMIHEEDFVIAMRKGHPFADVPTLDRFCTMKHLVVSVTGEADGFVDHALREEGRARRVALTVPNFLFAIAALTESDLLAALPRRFVELHADRFGVVYREPPLPLPKYQLHAVAPKAAMMDAGLAWLFRTLCA